MSGGRRRYPIGRADDIRPGTPHVVSVGGVEIGVFNLGARFVAYRNRCPHQGAPVCLGRVGGTTLPSAPGEYVYGRRDQVLHCPWHGWQFDLATGEALFGHRVRLARVDIALEDGELAVYLPAALPAEREAGSRVAGGRRAAPAQELA